MQGLGQDLGFVFRQLRRAPGFVLTVVLTLGLGIGATTAIFSLVEGILLRPLPFHDPERLVVLGDRLRAGSGISVTAPEIESYAKQSSAFASMGAHTGASYELSAEVSGAPSGGAAPERINAERMNASVFPTLGVEPELGRVFSAKEEELDQTLAVISYGLWMSRFHRDPGVLGKTIGLDRARYTIIGVMPKSFAFPLQAGRLNRVELWVPLSLTAEELLEQNAGFWGFGMVGRLRDGVTMRQGAEDTNRVAQEIMRNFPASMSAIHIQGDILPLRESLVADTRPMLRILFAAVSIVLLIACVNVASLSLVRAIRRRREYAVRLALGARSVVILRESALEGLMMGAAGGVVGLALAAAAIRIALHLLPESIPLVDSISIDGRVAVFALMLALLTGAVCSLTPAFAAMRTNLVLSLKDGAKSGTGGTSHAWLRSSLVVVEIAIALVLLILSGAFLRSFEKMNAVDPGYRSDHALVGWFQLPLKQYDTNLKAAAFNHTVLDRLAGKPGVEAVGISNSLPMLGANGESSYTVEGDARGPWKLKFAWFETVYGDFFDAMAIRLVDGRMFTADDRADTMPVVMVNETMAKHCWPGQRAIGKRMHAGNPKKNRPWATVIGVVADTKIGSRDEPSGEQWYSTADQPEVLSGPNETGALDRAAGGFVALRSKLPPEQLEETLRASVKEVDPLLALQQVEPMTAAVEKLDAPRRFDTDLVTAFATGALLLAITGIYAVVAFSVSIRVQEIAIRMALGAQRGGIARMVLVSAAKMAFAGCLIGVLGAVALSRLADSFLFEVSATDPLIYGLCVGIMVAVSLAASIIPAVRAASTDPIEALRTV